MKVSSSSYELNVNFFLETALNAESPEVLRLQERLEGFESQIGSLTRIQANSVFDYINSKFLHMTLKLDEFAEKVQRCSFNIFRVKLSYFGKDT